LEQLAERVETMMDRIEQARKIPLDQIGLSGQLEDVDVLDLIQMLELNQKTGALVLSHGERTGTLYFRDGAIVDADIRSPKREEPLFVLLGWKTGRYLFLPDAVPERMPITASLAHVLFEDLRRMEQNEKERTNEALPRAEPESGPAGRVLTQLDEIGDRIRSGHAAADQHVIRILIAGITGSGAGELVQHLVQDLSSSRWAAVGNEGQPRTRADFGLVRVSAETLLHLIAVRAEKRFRLVWEPFLPDAMGVILLLNPDIVGGLSHLETFVKAQQSLAPTLPLQALLPPHAKQVALFGLDGTQLLRGSIEDQSVRLSLLDRVLQQWLDREARAVRQS
jgi:hypothetical protein